MTFAVLVPWISLRARLFEVISVQIAILEFVGLASLTAFLTSRRLFCRHVYRISSPLLLLVVVLGVLNREELVDFPHYWSGFGVKVLLGSIAIFCFAVTVKYLKYRSERMKSFCSSHQHKFLNLVGLVVSVWTAPSIFQPMDGFLNLGDGTEKVLDEVAAWVTGRVPGVDLNWGHSTLLGLPLWPLSLLDGYGEQKIVVIVLWINLLIVACVLAIAGIFKCMVPRIPFLFATCIGLIAVTVSGEPINTSIFQELNYLARLLMPLLLGYAMISSAVPLELTTRARLVGLSLLSSLVLWNNIEFGAPAAASCGLVLAVAGSSRAEAKRRIVIFLTVHLAVAMVLGAIGFWHGEGWLSRRFGAAGGAINPGSMGIHNNVGPMPPFGVVSLTFGLAVVATAVSFRSWRLSNSRRHILKPEIVGMYVGLWVILSSVYSFYGVGGGAFRSQINVVFLFLLSISIGSQLHQHAKAKKIDRVESGTYGGLSWSQMRMLPLSLLLCVLPAAAIQAPNGLNEFRRLQTPKALARHVDEWSPEQLDWISPGGVTELAESFGGTSQVGWWFSYGNAIEILTGIENLMGTTAFEYAWRSGSFAESCRPLVGTWKSRVITHESSVRYIANCEGLKVRSVSAPNVDGLVVLEIRVIPN